MNDRVTVKDLAASLGITERAVQKKAKEKNWPAQDSTNPKGGRPIKTFPLSILSREDQEKVAKHRLEERLRNPMYLVDKNAQSSASKNAGLSIPNAGLSNPPTVPGQMTSGTGLTNSNKQAAPPARSDQVGLAKFNLVTAWRNLLESQPHGKKIEATQAFLLAYNSGRLLPGPFALVGPMASGTLRDLDKKLRASRDQNNGVEDYHAICDGRGGWRKHGTTLWRQRSLSNEAKDVFLSCWLRPEQPTVALAIRAARMMLEKRGTPEPSDDRTWRRWLEDWSKRSQHIIVLAREGEKAYRDKVGPYITRDDSMLEPGQVLIADGHDLNFQILHPQTGKPSRLKLVMFFDWASRMPVGWQIMPTENSVVIHAALRNAIIALGKVPDVVYLDNGKAFKAKVFTDSSPDLTEFTGIYARLGIATQFAQPYNARAKIIERFFQTLNEQFERLMSSYTGASIADKPAWTSRNEKFHKAMHAKRTGGWVPDIREAAWLVSLYIQWYSQQEHSGINFQKPADLLAAGRGPGVDVADLNYRMLWEKTAVPHRCRVTLFGIDYESDCLHGYADKVVVKYDCSDLAKIWFYTADREYLGEGLPVQALNPIARQLGDQVGVDQVKSAIARQRSLAKQTKAGLLELGASNETAEGLSALPWRQKAAVLPGGKSESAQPKLEAPMPEEEKARLELVASRAEAEIRREEESRPELERPEQFRSPAERFEWCWRAQHQHKAELTHEEQAFMAWYQTTEEFQTVCRQRIEDLEMIYCQ